MATMHIEVIKRVTGVKYKARVRKIRNNKKVFERSRTFSTKSEASSWAKLMLQELECNGVPNIERPKKSILIGDLLNLYLNDTITSKSLGRSKAAVLRRLRSYDIALIRADELDAQHLVRHCRERLSEPNAPLPQTVYQDVT